MDTHIRRGGNTPPAARPVYFVSDRPEAYEIGGEVGHDEAKEIARTIAERAGRHFPGVEFRVDGHWHTHPPGTEKVAAYIDAHWQAWISRRHGKRRAA